MGVFTKKFGLNVNTFDMADYLELNYEQLLSVNGGCGSGYSGSCGGGGKINTPKYINVNYYSIYGVNGGCSVAARVEQRDFTSSFGSNFGNHACAATSLLNEISEQYTAENGKPLTQKQVYSAMFSCVASGSIAWNDATVNDWQKAANDMAKAVGLSGSYTYTTNSSKASATIYAINPNENGVAKHFVNDIGNGKYYDPWTNKTGNISDLTFATDGKGGYRMLSYSKEK